MKFKRIYESDDFDVTASTDYETTVAAIPEPKAKLLQDLKAQLIEVCEGEFDYRMEFAERIRFAPTIQAVIRILQKDENWDLRSFCEVAAELFGFNKDSGRFVGYDEYIDTALAEISRIFGVKLTDKGWDF